MKNNYRVLKFLIRKFKFIVFVWAALAAAACLLFINSASFCSYNTMPYLYILALFLLLYCAVIMFMADQFMKINRILFTDCDPLAYINIYTDIIDALIKTKRPLNLDRYQLNLSAGLIAAGRYDEAYEALGRCKPFKNNRMGKISNVIYYNNLCSVCIKLGKIDEAKNYLDSLAGSAAALSPRDHQKYIKHVNMSQYGVNMEKGNFDNAENFYSEIVNTAASNYERVNAKFRLGKVYLHFGDTARAKEAFEYVIANGNKLHIVEEAKERLAHIKQ